MGESSTRRRRTAGSLAFVVLVTGLVTGLFAPTAARAGCVPPMIGVGPSGTSPSPSVAGVSTASPAVVLVAGDRIVVTGQYFSSCEDVVTCAGGCSACTAPTPDPFRGVELVLSFGGTFTSLGTADASNEDGGDRRPGVITWDVEIPQALYGSGPATLEARLHPDTVTTSTVASLPVTVG
jgi:hypothetical protein